MQIQVSKDRNTLGRLAAKRIAQQLNNAIADKGSARILLSTGASQIETILALVAEDVDWSKVTMFHLDEYIGIGPSHPSSFCLYLKERFVSRIPLKEAVFVDGLGGLRQTISDLTRRLREAPVDVGVIGIGENAHIAFNDPPADFQTEETYIVVTLDDRCKQQQVREGWFACAADVPAVALTITPRAIMRCECLVSPVPGPVKADAIFRTLSAKEVTPMIPATLLKTHPNFYLFLDTDSAADCPPELLQSNRS